MIVTQGRLRDINEWIAQGWFVAGANAMSIAYGFTYYWRYL